MLAMPIITKKTSTQLGFAVASFISGLTIVIVERMAGTHDALGVLGVLIFGYIFTWIPVLIFGLPAFLVLRHLRLVRWWSAVAGGLIIGGVVSVAIQHSIMAREFTVYTIAGTASGLCFWLIWILGGEK